MHRVHAKRPRLVKSVKSIPDHAMTAMLRSVGFSLRAAIVGSVVSRDMANCFTVGRPLLDNEEKDNR